MAAALPAVMIAATAFQAIGSLQAGQANAAVANFNAGVARQNAAAARQEAAADEIAQRKEGVLRLGAIRAAYGASGVVGNEGSPLDVLANSAATAELDALNIRYKGERRALGFEQTASLDSMRAKTARTAGLAGAGAAILTGASKFGLSRPGTSIATNTGAGEDFGLTGNE